jgi:hypothetical protein
LQAERKVGRPSNERRVEYMRRYEITLQRPQRVLTEEFMNQLDACATDTERRILLKGISK